MPWSSRPWTRSCRRSPASEPRNRHDRQHIEISLNELIHRQNLSLAELAEQQQHGDPSPCSPPTSSSRGPPRRAECSARTAARRAGPRTPLHDRRHPAHRPRLGRSPSGARHAGPAAHGPRRRDREHRRAGAIAYEEARGWQVESVEHENRGFDLISRSPTRKTRRPSRRFGSSRSKAAPAWAKSP